MYKRQTFETREKSCVQRYREPSSSRSNLRIACCDVEQVHFVSCFALTISNMEHGRWFSLWLFGSLGFWGHKGGRHKNHLAEHTHRHNAGGQEDCSEISCHSVVWNRQNHASRALSRQGSRLALRTSVDRPDYPAFPDPYVSDLASLQSLSLIHI